MAKCTTEKTRYQPKGDEWKCPKCGVQADHFYVDYGPCDDDYCEALHAKDHVICDVCDEYWSGEKVAELMTKGKKTFDDGILHKLWTKAVGTDGYDKEQWKELELLVHAGLATEPDTFACAHSKLLHEVQQLRERRKVSSGIHKALRARVRDALAAVVVARKYARAGDTDAAVEFLNKIQGLILFGDDKYDEDGLVFPSLMQDV